MVGTLNWESTFIDDYQKKKNRKNPTQYTMTNYNWWWCAVVFSATKVHSQLLRVKQGLCWASMLPGEWLGLPCNIWKAVFHASYLCFWFLLDYGSCGEHCQHNCLNFLLPYLHTYIWRYWLLKLTLTLTVSIATVIAIEEAILDTMQR